MDEHVSSTHFFQQDKFGAVVEKLDEVEGSVSLYPKNKPQGIVFNHSRASTIKATTDTEEKAENKFADQSFYRSHAKHEQTKKQTEY